MAKGTGTTKSVGSKTTSMSRTATVDKNVEMFIARAEAQGFTIDAAQKAEILKGTTFTPDKLTKEQDDAVYFYTDEGYGDIANHPTRKDIREKIAIIDSAFKPADKDYYLYRGHRTGRDTNKGYTSLTSDPSKAADFANYSAGGTVSLLRIPKGTPIIKYGGTEKEILLPRGTNIKRFRIAHYVK